MKITQTTNFTPKNYSISRMPQKTFYTVKTDTFTKSSVSFKAAPELNMFQKILKDPNLARDVMALVTLGASALVIGAKTDNIETDSTGESISTEKNGLFNIWGQMLGIKTETASSQKTQSEVPPKENIVEQEELPIDYKTKIDKLEKDNKNFLDRIKQLETLLKKYTTGNIPETPQISNQEETQNIVFPKKHGRLSKTQEELKTAVTGLSSNGVNKDLTTDVCKELLNKGSHNNIDNNDLAHNLAQELTANKDNPEKINEIISSYAEIIGIIPVKQEEKSDERAKKDKATASGTNSATLQTGVKVVGKIDLNSVEHKNRTQEIQNSSTDGIVENSSAEIVEHETLPKTYYYKVTGTLKPNIKTNLYDLFKCFKIKTRENRKLANDTKKIKWKLEKPVTKRVLKQDVENELKNDKYYNINKNNIDTVVDIINSDENYSKIFGLHSAMRFIDRFLDFDSDIALEEQASNAMEVLINTIRAALKKGVIMEEYVTPYYPNNDFEKEPEMLVGLRLQIPEDYYDKKALELFGTYPLRIGISGELGYCTRGAIIDTIFPNGI